MLSEVKRREVATEYEKTKSYKKAAAGAGCSEATVRRIVAENAKNKEASAEEVSVSVKDYINRRQGEILGIIGKCLMILNDDDKLRSATLPQIATAMATLYEKFTVDVIDATASKSADELSLSLMELAKGLRSDAVR